MKDKMKGNSKYNMGKVRRIITAITAITLLTGCAGYSSKFACGSSYGAKCIMIADIDKMIDSGEIEEYHINRKCKGNKKCSKTTVSPKLRRQ